MKDKTREFLISLIFSILVVLVIMIVLVLILNQYSSPEFAQSLCKQQGGWFELGNISKNQYYCHLANGSIINPLDIVVNMSGSFGNPSIQ